MKMTMKKILCTFLVVIMCLTASPLQGVADLKFNIEASAADELASTGKCGVNAKWNFNKSTGHLVISGTGNTYEKAFYNISSIKSVVVESGITGIGESTFYNCTNLTSVVLPDSVTTLNNLAFAQCTSLTSVTLGKGLKVIGWFSFVACTSLTTLEIPEGVTTIDYAAFEDCTRLSEISIPDSVTEIDIRAFKNCTNLKSIKLPAGITSISNVTFENCSSLTSITIPDGVESIGAIAFKGCTSLTSVYIPAGVKTISSDAFSNCNKINKIYYGGSEEQWAALGMSTSATVIYNVVRLGKCGDNLTYELYTNGDLIIKGTGEMYASNAVSYEDSKIVENIIIENGATSIPNYAFSNCHNLTSITIPASMKAISELAFNCENLKSVHITDLTAWCQIEISRVNAHPLFQYGSDLYLNGKLVTDLEIPQGLETIIFGAFMDYQGLRSVTIPDSVKTIGWLAFYNCSNLTSVTFGNGIDHIDNYIFARCTNLKSIVIPDGVTEIDSNVFEDCENLESVTLPSSLKTIDTAFPGCSNLKIAYYMGTKEQWEKVIGYSSCGLSDIIHFIDHNYKEEIITPATHLADGLKGFNCICGESYTEVIPKITEHSHQPSVTPPTCTSKGYTTYTCVCGNTYTDDYVDMIDHEYEATITKQPTHKEEGLKTLTCVCGETYTEPVATIPHSYSSSVIEPDCVHRGYTLHACNCGESYNDNYVDALGHTYENGYCIRCNIPEGYIGIYTKEDLDSVRNNLSANYMLMNDINFNDADFEKDGAFYNNGNGWKPLGYNNNDSINFTGIFDGNGYSINNLTIDGKYHSSLFLGYNDIGLFYTNSGIIRNLTVDADIYVETDSIIYMGIICGANNGKIDNCHTTGTISANLTSNNCADSFLGGICGGNFGGEIINCSNAATLESYSSATFPFLNCGGIAGGISQFYPATISSCYNTGNIIPYGSNGGYIGGIVGRTCIGGGSPEEKVFLSIIDCYNTGVIAGPGIKSCYIGGISGDYNDVSIFKNCYNIAVMDNTVSTYGAIFGTIWWCLDILDISTCYYLNTSCDYAGEGGYNSNLNIIGNRLTDSEMKIEDSFVGFDFEETWIVDGQSDYPYPQLRNNLQSKSEPVRHSYGEPVIKDSTCVEKGTKTWTCSDCGFSVVDEIPVIAHSFTNYISDGNATCTADGTKTATCDGCTATNTITDVSSKKPHEYTGKITKQPTHTQEGIKTFTCKCGNSYTESVAKLTEHSYSSRITTQPTHLTEGIRTYTCACGSSYTEPVAKLTNHTYTSEITTQPTHLTEGIRTYTCKCGDTYTMPVAKIPHSYNEAVTAPTCTEQGFTTYTCACGDSYIANYVSAKGHSHIGTVTTPATHTTTGVKTYICSCGDTYTEVIPKLSDEHSYTGKVTAPTCTAQGYTTYTCACGYSYKGNYTATAPHSYTSKVTKPATHLAEGVNTYTCSACGDTYTEAIAKIKEHTYTVYETIKPDCTNDGYTVYICQCGDSYEGDFVSAHGHSYNGDTCVNCGKSKVENCNCNCHKGGINGIIWKILRFFYKLFGIKKTCACGATHY